MIDWWNATGQAKVKSFFNSFTNWFNTGGAAILLTIYAAPEVQSLLTADGVSWILIIGNVAIRTFKTSQAIEDK